MIALVHGQGSVGSRLLGEVVPLGVTIVAASVGGAFWGVTGAIVVGVPTWLLTSLLLMRVRRVRWMRRTYRSLLALHVVFWSLLGLGLFGSERVPPDPEPTVAGATQASPFRAGMATTAFDLPERTTLAGWGMSPRRQALPAFGGFGLFGRLTLDWMGPPGPGEAARVPMFMHPSSNRETLGARALVILPENGPALGIVRLDLIAVDAALARLVLTEVEDLDFRPSTLLVAATHTHSAPGGALESPLAQMAGSDHFDAGIRDEIVAAAAGALRSAVKAARPARIAFAVSRDRGDDGRPILARDRCRGDDAPIDDRVFAMRLEGAGDGVPIGVLLHYAIQPVKMRGGHVRFSRDMAGALEENLSARLPGTPPVLFLNGAMGNASPRHTPESGAAGALLLAARFAERVAPDIEAASAIDRLRVRASRVDRHLPPGRTFVALGSRAGFHDHVLPSAIGEDAPAVFANVISLPANVLIWSLCLPEIRVGFSFDGAVGAVVDVGHPGSGVCGSVVLADDAGAARAVLLWQGGIPTIGVGRAWRRAVATRGLPAPYVLSNTNAAFGYLTTPEEYDGRCQYEARSTLYGRDTGAWMQARLLEAVDLAAAVD